MSAKSRSRRYVDLPIGPRDFIVSMDNVDEDHVILGCQSGRMFVMTKAVRYKRPFKIHEMPPLTSPAQ